MYKCALSSSHRTSGHSAAHQCKTNYDTEELEKERGVPLIDELLGEPCDSDEIERSKAKQREAIRRAKERLRDLEAKRRREKRRERERRVRKLGTLVLERLEAGDVELARVLEQSMGSTIEMLSRES